MLFQSDYWVAANYSEKKETIQRFLETDEGITTLVVIEMGSANNIQNILNESEIPCVLNILTESNTITYEPDDSSYSEDAEEAEEADAIQTKTIYVRRAMDDDTMRLLIKLQPILAIFTP